MAAPGLWNDGQIDGLARITALYREYGVTPGIQFGHAGRRPAPPRPWEGARPLTDDSPDPPWQTVGPSAVPEREGYPVPHELTSDEISCHRRGISAPPCAVPVAPASTSSRSTVRTAI